MQTTDQKGRLAGRVAIVTGASRGLGKAIAVGLAKDGASVAVAARTEAVWDERLPGTIGETVEEIRAAGGVALAVRADMTVLDDLKGLVETTRAELGPITLLVNNAAFTAPGRPGRTPPPSPPSPTGQPGTPATGAASARPAYPTVLTAPLSAYKRHFEVTLFSAYELIQLAARDMIELGIGGIVNVSSGASQMPGPGPYTAQHEHVLAGYGGSKAALEHLTQAAAYELQQHNVAVNALSPSVAIATPGVRYFARDFDQFGSEEDFAEATIRLLLADPVKVSGQVWGHTDLLG